MALDPVDPERATSALLARELDRLLVEPLVVCLDDAETLERVVCDGVARVAGRLIGGDSSLLRVAPRQPPAARTSGSLVSVQREQGSRVAAQADLAFSAGRIPDVPADEHAAANRRPDEVDVLMEHTEGWPLGIVLAGRRCGAGSGGPSPGLLDDYFEEEVLTPAVDPRAAPPGCWRRPRLPTSTSQAASGATGRATDLGNGRGLFLSEPRRVRQPELPSAVQRFPAPPLR